MHLMQIEQASKLVAEIALELHRDSKMLIDECIERAAFGVMFALEVSQPSGKSQKV